MDRLMDLCRDRGLLVIEDTAQALGADYRGKKAGTTGTAGCYSFFPSKNLGAAGDAGLVTTDDDDLAKHIRRLRVHGGEPRYYHHEIGFNFRIDTLQCAILLVKLPYLDGWNSARRQVAARYGALFGAAGLSAAKGGPVRLPEERPDAHSIYHQYSIRIPATDRDDLVARLTARKVGNAIYYPVPLHMQPCFKDLGYEPQALPVSFKAASEVLALPIYPELTADQQERVVSIVGGYFAR
jgi:dTDP-4-amino-4,6-dideoxygalactose transaminase